LLGRSHERVPNVVAEAGHGSEADQITAAELLTIAADGFVVGMPFRQPHLRPDLQSGAVDSIPALDVLRIGPAIVEKVESDQLDTLVFEVEERAIDSIAIWT
jgi:hypothetical protein